MRRGGDEEGRGGGHFEMGDSLEQVLSKY